MSVKHDATRIKADMGRLLVICKTLNDVVIPKANVFLRYGEKLLASDLKATLDALYADETIRPLEEQRKMSASADEGAGHGNERPSSEHRCLYLAD